MPFFSILMPRSFQEKYPNEMRNLRLNSRKLTTPFDIHETLKHLLNFHQPNPLSSQSINSAKEKPERGISLFKYISANRSCEDVQIEAHWCSCLNWIDLNITSAKPPDLQLNLAQNEIEEIETDDYLKENENINTKQIKTQSQSESVKIDHFDYNKYKKIRSYLKIYSRTALLIANKAVRFMNSLIEGEYKKFCEKIYLKSIERLSKLDLNQKLLAFKESRDIHGREAVFEDLNSTSTTSLDYNLDDHLSNLTQFDSSQNKFEFNLTNATHYIANSSKLDMDRKLFLSSDIIFQIVLTTWPSNATFELSLKYQRNNASFKFNKNEISRINNYNGTSNCMLDKRPDLRQFCFCRNF